MNTVLAMAPVIPELGPHHTLRVAPKASAIPSSYISLLFVVISFNHVLLLLLHKLFYLSLIDTVCGSIKARSQFHGNRCALALPAANSPHVSVALGCRVRGVYCMARSSLDV